MLCADERGEWGLFAIPHVQVLTGNAYGQECWEHVWTNGSVVGQYENGMFSQRLPRRFRANFTHSPAFADYGRQLFLQLPQHCETGDI